MNDQEKEVLRQKQILQKLIADSRLPLRTRTTHRLSTFIVGDENGDTLATVLNYIPLKDDFTEYSESDFDAWEAPHCFLTLYGPTGRGKTHLAIGIAWQKVETGFRVVYWQAEALLDELRACFGENDSASFKRIMHDCQECDLLILDDLGAEQSTPWARARLDLIIDSRYVNELETVFTTNCRPDQLSERIASRIAEGQICTLEGQDFRILKGARNNYKRQKGVGK